MEFTELIAKRRSVRRYKPVEIPVSDIERMADAARLAPSGKNLQYRHFVAVKNNDLIRRIGNAVSEENERICRVIEKADKARAAGFRADLRAFAPIFRGAPLLFVVMAKSHAPYGELEMNAAGLNGTRLALKSPNMQSLGAAVEHLMLCATELGYGSCQITSANYADEGITATLREAGFDKPGYFVAALVSVGVPEETPASPPKKPLSEILTIVE
jgi:nitroreductase